MDMVADDTRLPPDIDAQPLVQAAAAMRPMLRRYQEELEQRAAAAACAGGEELEAAGFYRMVIPRSLGGLQVDPLTYLRVVELLAEGCGSVGWNVCNNSIGQLVTLGSAGRRRAGDARARARPVMAGTAVQGGGQAVPVDGRLSRHRALDFRQRLPGKHAGCWGVSRSWRRGSRGAARMAGRCTGAACFRAQEAEVVPGSWDVAGLRGTGSFDWTVKDVFLPERRSMVHAGVPLDNQWSRWPGVTYALPSAVLGRAAP